MRVIYLSAAGIDVACSAFTIVLVVMMKFVAAAYSLSTCDDDDDSHAAARLFSGHHHKKRDLVGKYINLLLLLQQQSRYNADLNAPYACSLRYANRLYPNESGRELMMLCDGLLLEVPTLSLLGEATGR